MITKPLLWAVHSGKDKENVVPIFSIDVSPRGDWFATGGEDGAVNVWSFAKALDSASSESALLAQLSCHDKAVNSVRFNLTGRLLASGGSDGVVCVAAWVPPSSASHPAEWRPFRKWHQQKLDVSEVCWGTNERTSLLASCSLDGTIVIWDVERGQTVHVISGHKNMIKGLAWDPLGQYLASQAEAEGIFIWRTSDWKCTKQIDEPFRDAVDCSDHLRLSWSPNGMYLTGVQAYSLPQPYVAVLKRDRWNVEFCVVGHRSGVSVSKWNPRFFMPREASGAQERRLAMCLCLGSADRSFSLWLQTEQHPMLHMDGYFENRISDIAWSADGYTCLVSSRDGCVALCNFTEAELGEAADYKVSLKDVFPSSSKMPVAESLDLWMLEHNRVPEKEMEGQEKRVRMEIVGDAASGGEPMKRQKKSKTPEFIAARMAIDGAPPERPRPKSKTKTTSAPTKLRANPHPEDAPQTSSAKKQGKASFVHSCGKMQLMDGEWVTVELYVENGLCEKRCTIVRSEGEREVWRDEIHHRAVAVSGNLHFGVVATDASSLYVYDDVGIQLISALHVPSSISMLITDDDWHLMSLTNCGELSLWHVKERRLVCRTSVCSLCKDAHLSTIKIKLTPNAMPLVTLTDGQAFFYNTSLEAWTLFEDSSQSRTGRVSLESIEDDVDEAIQRLSVHSSPSHVRKELEQQIRNAVDLEDGGDYRKWLLAYVRFLICRVAMTAGGGKDEETKLRKICFELLREPDARLIGDRPMTFLRNEILPQMFKVRDLQRLSEEVMEWVDSSM